MKSRSEEAARLEADYLARLAAAAVPLGRHEAAELVDSIREHIEEAAAELPTDMLSLTQMATILDRLGPPASCLDDRVNGAAGTPSPVHGQASSDTERRTDPELGGLANADFAEHLDRLWVAYLISIIGLYVPFIDLFFCDMAAMVFIGLLLSRRAALPQAWRFAGTLAWVDLGLLAFLTCIATVSLAVPLAGIVALPLALGSTGVFLALYWNTIGGILPRLRQIGETRLSETLITARRTYLVSVLLVTAVAFVVGIAIGIACAGNRGRVNLIVELVTPVVALPLNWLLGWLFVLRPIGHARRAIAAAPDTSPTAKAGAA